MNDSATQNEARPAPAVTWRPGRCPECDWAIEINNFGERTLCACDVTF